MRACLVVVFILHCAEKMRHLIGPLWSRECHRMNQNGVEMTCDGKLELTFGHRCSFLKEKEWVLFSNTSFAIINLDDWFIFPSCPSRYINYSDIDSLSLMKCDHFLSLISLSFSTSDLIDHKNWPPHLIEPFTNDHSLKEIQRHLLHGAPKCQNSTQLHLWQLHQNCRWPVLLPLQLQWPLMLPALRVPSHLQVPRGNARHPTNCQTQLAKWLGHWRSVIGECVILLVQHRFALSGHLKSKPLLCCIDAYW